METEKPLVNKDYLLEKFAGKGGWTYAKIPEILQNKNTPFGWVTVRGTIDGVAINNYKLMPMGNGKLMLAVNASVRNKIKKKVGDYVTVILYADNLPAVIPEELQLCLQDEPKAFEQFLNYSISEQKAFVQWIYAAKTTAIKVKRITITIGKLLTKQKLTTKVNG